jgi:hypothetical protein
MDSDLWPGRSELQEIAPCVYITNYFGAKNRAKLNAAGITHILVCASELPFAFETSFRYKRLDIADNTGVVLPIEEAISWIDDGVRDGGRVLLHCAAGSSRSGAIGVAYLIKGMWLQCE